MAAAGAALLSDSLRGPFVGLYMPGVDGLEVTRRLSGPAVPNPARVVAVTTFDLDEYVHAALSGGALVSPQITTRLLRHFATRRAPTVSADCGLSPRELDVVRAVATGLTNAELAEKLHISLGTVKSHLGSVQTKLQARNRVEIAAWAFRSGLTDQSE